MIRTQVVAISTYIAPVLFFLAAAFCATDVPARSLSGAQTDSSIRPATSAAAPRPTLADVLFGRHSLQTLDFYRANSSQVVRLVFFVHGGAWLGGDKATIPDLDRYLATGVSVVSINYRFSNEAQLANVRPPLQWPMQDVAYALQFVRMKAREWTIDKTRIGASGSSAGACSALWLAYHDDLADRGSADPVLRESTRLCCVAVTDAQTTLDPQQMKAWTPNSRYGGHAFGFMSDPKNTQTCNGRFAEFLAAPDEILPWIEEYSPFYHVSADDPPTYLFYAAPPAVGQFQKDPTHSANFGVKLQEKLRGVGIECELVYPGATGVQHPGVCDYLIKRLKQ